MRLSLSSLSLSIDFCKRLELFLFLFGFYPMEFFPVSVLNYVSLVQCCVMLFSFVLKKSNIFPSVKEFLKPLFAKIGYIMDNLREN